MSESKAQNLDCLWLGNRVLSEKFLYQDMKGKVKLDCGPWAGLLLGNELYRFPTNRLRVIQVKRSDLYEE